MIEGCKYSRALEVHRLVEGKDGGKYEIGNAYAVCPNHHAEITRGWIVVEKIDDKTLRIVKRAIPRIDKFCFCGAKIFRTSTSCHKCANRKTKRKTKIKWPNTDILQRMVEETSYLAVGKKLGVSDNAVRKRIKTH
jgi:hypothetical protein